jgi:hypothetical protein
MSTTRISSNDGTLREVRVIRSLRRLAQATLPFAALIPVLGAACASSPRVQPTQSARPVPLSTTPVSAPPTFVVSTSDLRTTRIVPLRDGFTKQTAFKTASDALTSLSGKVTIDVSDPTSGFLMTRWQATFTRDGVPELRYRTRIILRFLPDSAWTELAVRAEANWQRGEEWEIGFDEKLLEQVTSELATKLGKPR